MSEFEIEREELAKWYANQAKSSFLTVEYLTARRDDPDDIAFHKERAELYTKTATLLRQPVAPVVDEAMVERALNAVYGPNERSTLQERQMRTALEAALKGEK